MEGRGGACTLSVLGEDAPGACRRGGITENGAIAQPRNGGDA